MNKNKIVSVLMVIILSSIITLNYGNLVKAENVQNKYIDRIDLPDYASNFYKALEESTDKDGVNDYLIDDKYFTSGSTKDLNTYISKKQKLYTIVQTPEQSCMLVAQVLENESRSNYIDACNHIRTAFMVFEIDHPEVFWLCGSNDLKFLAVQTTNSGRTISHIFLVLKTFNDSSSDIRDSGEYTEETIKYNISEMNQSVKNILSNMPDGNSASDIAKKIKYFNSWLTKNNEYNTSKDYINFSGKSISALLGNIGERGPVCRGYSFAFKVLCDRAKIPCIVVVGIMDESFHAWNYVQIGQLWYAVDTTWNDTPVVFVDQNGNRLLGRANSGKETEKYLLVGQNTLIDKKLFKDSHSTDINIFKGANNIEYTLTPGPILNKKAYKF